MEDLSLHILDIAENSLAAGARHLSIVVCEDTEADLLSLEVSDDGKGMSEEAAVQAADPFYTSRTTRRVGMGLALLREAATAANGRLEIRSIPAAGTTVTATFQRSHIDRKPLGNMGDTVAALLAADGTIDVVYRHTRDGKEILFDSRAIRSQLGEACLKSVDTLNYIRNYLNQEEHIIGS